jgi:hypothetical protein
VGQFSDVGSREFVLEDVRQSPYEAPSIDQALRGNSATMIEALPDGVRIMVNAGVDEVALGAVLRALSLVEAQ